MLVFSNSFPLMNRNSQNFECLLIYNETIKSAINDYCELISRVSTVRQLASQYYFRHSSKSLTMLCVHIYLRVVCHFGRSRPHCAKTAEMDGMGQYWKVSWKGIILEHDGTIPVALYNGTQHNSRLMVTRDNTKPSISQNSLKLFLT